MKRNILSFLDKLKAKKSDFKGKIGSGWKKNMASIDFRSWP